MTDIRNCPLFVRDAELGYIVCCKPTMNEIRIARGYLHMLEVLVKSATKDTAWSSAGKSKLFGATEYRVKYKGRVWWHSMRFINEPQAFFYEEMRHGLQMAIYGMCGESVDLSISFDRQTAVFRLKYGKKLEPRKIGREEVLGLSNVL